MIFDKVLQQCNENTNVSLTCYAWIIVYLYGKNVSQPLLTSYTKSKLLTDQNERPKNVRLLEDNIEENLCNLKRGQVFLDKA